MASGRTLPDVLTMALPEYVGWARFLTEHPPGDVRTQLLLATLCAMVYNALGAKGAKGKQPQDYMPWLSATGVKSAEAAAVKGEAAKQAEINRRQVAELQARLRAERESLG